MLKFEGGRLQVKHQVLNDLAFDEVLFHYSRHLLRANLRVNHPPHLRMDDGDNRLTLARANTGCLCDNDIGQLAGLYLFDKGILNNFAGILIVPRYPVSDIKHPFLIFFTSCSKAARSPFLQDDTWSASSSMIDCFLPNIILDSRGKGFVPRISSRS
jgi:hypothetical protein